MSEIQFGIAAVLFVGLAFGAMDPAAFVIPEFIYVLGLILFVYTIGLQSGPMFFNLFRRQWLRLTGLALILAGAVVFLSLEWNTALKGYDFGGKVLVSLFHSVTTRTAGYNTVDIGALSAPVLIFFIT